MRFRRFQVEGEFSTVLADPPWLERGGGKIKRGADRHYPLLATHDIPRVMMAAPEWRIAENAHLYLWVTNNFLPDGLRVMADLDFRYITNICWVKRRDEKLQTGLGQYFRGAHELLLFGVRGKGLEVRSSRRDLRTVLDEPEMVEAPRSVHSGKPAVFHELVEHRSNGPYLEMFARSKRPGWTSWGNEVSDA